MTVLRIQRVLFNIQQKELIMIIKKLRFKTKTVLVMVGAVMLLCSGMAYAGDADGDGVPDTEDLCPDTPKGATVNKNGCWALKGVKLFDFDSSSIKPEGQALLDEVAVILENNPEITGELRGHTDSTGSEEYNLQLSEKRAKAVEEYLENKGIDPSRLTSVGYGERQPIESNETPEGREENRRVELVRIK
jgi:OOP family OmpA-OmpF porin